MKSKQQTTVQPSKDKKALKKLMKDQKTYEEAMEKVLEKRQKENEEFKRKLDQDIKKQFESIEKIQSNQEPKR